MPRGVSRDAKRSTPARSKRASAPPQVGDAEKTLERIRRLRKRSYDYIEREIGRLTGEEGNAKEVAALDKFVREVEIEALRQSSDPKGHAAKKRSERRSYLDAGFDEGAE